MRNSQHSNVPVLQHSVTYLQTIDFLNNIRLFGQMLGLDTMRELLRRMGNPQDRLRFIHIAGTNGKGSVAAMCHSVLTAAGYKTGLYTSPHLVSFCERFQISGQLISEADVVRLVEQIKPHLAAVGAVETLHPPTFFETVTAMALQYFAEQGVEIVVWETGLGGRLDATNVVTPLVSVITNIAFDHMQYLGNTLAQIAHEKCGIIKPGVPVVTAAEGEALAVIQRTCDELGSPLIEAANLIRGSGESSHPLQAVALARFGTVEIPLLGQHQQLNCATAVAALEASGLQISAAVTRDGLRNTNWPGRFQIVAEHPTVVLDGAHNAEGARRLAVTVREYFGGQNLTLILGVLRDKNYDEMCRLLAPLASLIVCVPVNSDRTSDPVELAALCRAANPQTVVETSGNVRDAFAMAKANNPEVIVIAGSLFLVGEAMDRLGFARTPATCEQELVLQ